LDYYDEDLYFAKQVIVNACATQAILAILMNNEDKLELGQDLMELKNFTRGMDPYMKGLTISNCERIRLEHNKFSRPEPFVFNQNKQSSEKEDVFHFVAYLHSKNNIYEIDGLKEGPILIAENVENKNWITHLKPSIINRVSLYATNEIKFNLLAVVPDRRIKAIETEQELTERKNYIISIFNNGDSMIDKTFPEYNELPKEELSKILSEIEIELDGLKTIIEEENQKFEKFRLENERRQHNYIPMIFELLKIMAEKNALVDIIKEEESKQAKK
jgi:ubiquitin carboxyl-terminal hydrolase L5